ncbi:MAG: glycosyltransferase family 4 protein [Flavobacteriales bacterium]
MKAHRKRKRSVDTGYDPEPMRVLHVSTPMGWRGGEQQLAYLYHWLEEKGVQQSLLVPKGSALELHCQAWGMPFASFSGKGPLGLGVARALKALTNAYAPDLIHVHDAHGHTAAFLATLLFRQKLPLIVHRRVDFPVGKHFLSRWKFDHPAISRVIAVSEAIRGIGRKGVRQKDKWVTVRSGIDTSRVQERKDPTRIRKELGLASDIPIIGNIAALADHKDHFTFLRTARTYFDKGKRGVFVILGDGPERSSIEAERHRLGLEDGVRVMGFRDDVLELLSGFDVFLMSSKTEGLGTSLLDAMAASIPIVSTNAGGIPEILCNEQNALLREVGDAKGLAESLVHLLEHPDQREQLVKDGLRTAERYSCQNMAEAVLSVYSSVLDRADGS